MSSLDSNYKHLNMLNLQKAIDAILNIRKSYKSIPTQMGGSFSYYVDDAYYSGFYWFGTKELEITIKNCCCLRNDDRNLTWGAWIGCSLGHDELDRGEYYKHVMSFKEVERRVKTKNQISLF